MLKDNLYGYGSLTRILNILFIILLFSMYLGAMMDYTGINRSDLGLYDFSVFLLLFVLIAKSIWYFYVIRPMCFTKNVINCFLVKFNLFIIYVILFIIIIGSIFFFILDSYLQYSVDVKMKVSYNFFHITIIPFSVIKFIGYILENHLHVNIANLRVIVSSYTSILIKMVLPFFIFLFIVQLIYSKRKYKYF